MAYARSSLIRAPARAAAGVTAADTDQSAR